MSAAKTSTKSSKKSSPKLPIIDAKEETKSAAAQPNQATPPKKVAKPEASGDSQPKGPTVDDLLKLARTAGCEVEEKAKFWKLALGGYRMYVAKTERAATRIDLSRFSISGDGVKPVKEGTNGQVQAIIRENVEKNFGRALEKMAELVAKDEAAEKAAKAAAKQSPKVVVAGERSASGEEK